MAVAPRRARTQLRNVKDHNDSQFSFSLPCKHNYPRILDAIFSRYRDLGQFWANVGDSDHFSRRTTGRIVMPFMFRSYKKTRWEDFRGAERNIRGIIDRDRKTPRWERGYHQDLGQPEYVMSHPALKHFRTAKMLPNLSSQNAAICRIPREICAVVEIDSRNKIA